MFRTIRLVMLLFVLLIVGVGSWQTKQRIARWDVPLRAVVYPIVGDDSDSSRRYVETLDADTFQPIETFIDDEAARWGVARPYGRPVKIRVAPEVKSLPPPPPTDGNILRIMGWSLWLR